MATKVVEVMVDDATRKRVSRGLRAQTTLPIWVEGLSACSAGRCSWEELSATRGSFCQKSGAWLQRQQLHYWQSPALYPGCHCITHMKCPLSLTPPLFAHVPVLFLSSKSAGCVREAGISGKGQRGRGNV